MIELLWLLLPVAAASGWWAARRSAANHAPGRASLSADYFKGLNYLVNEQPDKAIEVFVRLVEVDSETIEMHLALGNLFRRRGEVDRAIRIHQNLITRPTLDPEQRAHALLELGLDHLRAGLLDRAEALFQELTGHAHYGATALANLVEVYQLERDWEKAGETLERLQTLTGESHAEVLAQYQCERAEQARAAAAVGEAHACLQRALRLHPDCVRASLIEAELHRAAGDHEAAITSLMRVERQDARFLPEIVAPLMASYQALGRARELIAYLLPLVQRCGDVVLTAAVAELMAHEQGLAPARGFLIEQLRGRPSVQGLERLLALELDGASGVRAENLALLKDLMARLIAQRPQYQCRRCGFGGQSLYWQCPGCKSWNTQERLAGTLA